MQEIQQIKDMVSKFSIDELKILQMDLKTANTTLKLVNEIIEKHEMAHKVCASCGIPIDPFSKDKMVLTFGSCGFEKRAHFCAHDCMTYFLERIKQIKEQ